MREHTLYYVTLLLCTLNPRKGRLSMWHWEPHQREQGGLSAETTVLWNTGTRLFKESSWVSVLSLEQSLIRTFLCLLKLAGPSTAPWFPYFIHLFSQRFGPLASAITVSCTHALIFSVNAWDQAWLDSCWTFPTAITLSSA